MSEKAIKELKDEIARGFKSYEPSQSSRGSKVKRNAQRHLREMESRHNQMIKENGYPKYLFRHVVEDMGISLNPQRPGEIISDVLLRAKKQVEKKYFGEE